jgi:hypothetical protein
MTELGGNPPIPSLLTFFPTEVEDSITYEAYLAPLLDTRHIQSLFDGVMLRNLDPATLPTRDTVRCSGLDGSFHSRMLLDSMIVV